MKHGKTKPRNEVKFMDKKRLLIQLGTVVTSAFTFSSSLAALTCQDVFLDSKNLVPLKKSNSLMSTHSQSDLLVNGFYIRINQHHDGKNQTTLSTYQINGNKLLELDRVLAPLKTQLDDVSKISSDLIAVKIQQDPTQFGSAPEAGTTLIYRVSSQGKLELTQTLKPTKKQEILYLKGLNDGSPYVLAAIQPKSLNSQMTTMAYRIDGGKLQPELSLDPSNTFHLGSHPNNKSLHFLRTYDDFAQTSGLVIFNSQTGKVKTVLKAKSAPKKPYNYEPTNHISQIDQSPFLAKGTIASHSTNWLDVSLYHVSQTGKIQLVQNVPVVRRNSHTPFSRTLTALGSDAVIVLDNHSYASGPGELNPLYKTYVRDYEIKIVSMSDKTQNQVIKKLDRIPLALKDDSSPSGYQKNPEASSLAVQSLGSQEFALIQMGEVQIYRKVGNQFKAQEKIKVGDQSTTIQGTDHFKVTSLNEQSFVLENSVFDKNSEKWITQVSLFQKNKKNTFTLTMQRQFSVAREKSFSVQRAELINEQTLLLELSEGYRIPEVPYELSRTVTELITLP